MTSNAASSLRDCRALLAPLGIRATLLGIRQRGLTHAGNPGWESS